MRPALQHSGAFCCAIRFPETEYGDMEVWIGEFEEGDDEPCSWMFKFDLVVSY